MSSSFSLKMPSPAVGPVCPRPLGVVSPPALLFPTSSWNFLTNIPAFLDDEDMSRHSDRDDSVKQYGRLAFPAAHQTISREMPAAWEFQVAIETNPDTAPLYALAKRYSSVALGAAVNGNGEWRLFATGTGPQSAPSAGPPGCDETENGKVGPVPEYYKTAIHEVAILLLQQYTNYHWMN